MLPETVTIRESSRGGRSNNRFASMWRTGTRFSTRYIVPVKRHSRVIYSNGTGKKTPGEPGQLLYLSICAATAPARGTRGTGEVPAAPRRRRAGREATREERACNDAERGAQRAGCRVRRDRE